eukprot:7601801-Prorocentrum_lima.AAC.1
MPPPVLLSVAQDEMAILHTASGKKCRRPSSCRLHKMTWRCFIRLPTKTAAARPLVGCTR